MSEERSDLQLSETKEEQHIESTFGGAKRCLSYDRYVKVLERKKKKKSCPLWLLLTLLGIACAALTVVIWLWLF